MHLRQTHRKFATTPLAGWDGEDWVSNISMGAMEVYSRFITDRSFGVVKRIFSTPEPIPEAYKAVRLPNGDEYLITSHSTDIVGEEVYGNLYLLLQVTAYARIVNIVVEPSASGMGRNAQQVPSDPIPCYFERYGGTNSSEVDAVTYSRTRLLFPRGTVLEVDDDVLIGESRYTVREQDLELDLVRAFALEQ